MAKVRDMLKNLFLNERNIMVAILLNAAVIFLMYFPEFKDQLWLELIDQAFILFFVVEAIVKLYYLKPKGYFSVGWNRFDFAIILLSLPTLLINVIDIPDTSLLILLRMFRLVRLVRFIRFIPNMTQVMEGLGRALKASVFVLALLVVFDFLLALFACHFFGDTTKEYFGNPLISAYSIFQLFTIEGWNEISAETIATIDHPVAAGFTRMFFVFIVLCGGIFGLSLANAIFVDEMTIDNNRVLEEKIDDLQVQLSELKELLVQQTKNQRL